MTFDEAIAAIRAGAHYSLQGLTLTVNGVALAITEEQFDIAWDVLDEVDVDATDSLGLVSLPGSDISGAAE